MSRSGSKAYEAKGTAFIQTLINNKVMTVFHLLFKAQDLCLHGADILARETDSKQIRYGERKLVKTRK